MYQVVRILYSKKLGQLITPTHSEKSNQTQILFTPITNNTANKCRDHLCKQKNIQTNTK